MDKIEIVCPFCGKSAAVNHERINEPWVCMFCDNTIENPYEHRKSDAEQISLSIPLQGRIISMSGTTNLSDLVASSATYAEGFMSGKEKPPTRFDLGKYNPRASKKSYSGQYQVVSERRRMWLIFFVIATLLVAGVGALFWFVLWPMLKA